MNEKRFNELAKLPLANLLRLNLSDHDMLAICTVRSDYVEALDPEQTGAMRRRRVDELARDMGIPRDQALLYFA